MPDPTDAPTDARRLRLPLPSAVPEKHKGGSASATQGGEGAREQ